MTDFISGVNDFSCSDAPLTDAQFRNATANNTRIVLHVPETSGAVIVAAKLPQSANGRTFWLTQELIALIFSGVIKRWDDPRLLAVNGGSSAAWFADRDNDIVVIRRNDSSGTTFAFTDALRKTTTAWTTPAANAPSFPFWVNGTRACTGTAGVSMCLNSTTYGIAYLEYGQAIELGDAVSVATVRDASCVFTEPSLSTVSSALASAFFVPPARDASWAGFSVAGISGGNVWPSATLSYILVRQNQLGRGARGAATKAVLDWAMSREAQQFALLHGLVPLAPKFAEETQIAIRRIQVDDEELYESYRKLLLPKPRQTTLITLAPVAPPAPNTTVTSSAVGLRDGLVPRLLATLLALLRLAGSALAQATTYCLHGTPKSCNVTTVRDSLRLITYGPVEQPQFAPLFAAQRFAAFDQQCISVELTASNTGYDGVIAAVSDPASNTPLGVTSVQSLLAHRQAAGDAASVVGLMQVAKRSSWWLIAHKPPHAQGIASADVKLLGGKTIWRAQEQPSRALLRKDGVTATYATAGTGAVVAAEFLQPNAAAAALEVRPHIELAAILTTQKDASNASSPLWSLSDFHVFRLDDNELVAWPDDVIVVNSAWYAANQAVAERLYVSLIEAFVFCRDATLACASASPSGPTTRWPRVLAVNAYMDIVFDDKTAIGAAPPNLLNNYRTNIRALGLAAVPSNLSASFVDGSIDGTLANAARIITGIDEADSRTAHSPYVVPFCSFQLRVGATAAPCGTLFDDIDFVIPPPLPPATSYVPGPPLITQAPVVTVEQRLTDGEVAGIVVGSVAAFLLLLGLVAFVYVRGQRKLAAQNRHLEEAQAELEQRAKDSAQMSGDAVKIATTAYVEASESERQAMATFTERRQWRAAPELGYGDTPVSLELLPLRVSATQLTFGIGAQGGRLVQATAGQQLVQRITLSNPKDAPQAVAWELVPVPPNFLYSLSFTPSSGTLQPGEEVVFTAKLISFAVKKIRFTTALLLPDFKQFIDLKMSADVGIGQLLDPSELQFANEPVSQGSAGAIFEGLWRGQHVAIKKFKQQEQLIEEIPTNGSLWTEYMLEVRMLARLRHKKVVGFVGSVIVPMHMCIVTEWIPYGSLQTAVHTYSINPGLKGKLVLDVIDALRYCHENQIMHRDVKPSNVLIESFAPNAAVNCKLGDFGSSREDRTASAAEKEAAEKETQVAVDSLATDDAPVDDFTKGVGTPVFMAPEIFRYEPHTTKSDIYSFGLLVYATFLETSPWHKESKAYNVASKVKKGKRPPLPKGEAEQLAASEDESIAETAVLPACVRALVIKCWAQEQADRPTADEAYDTIVAFFASQALPEAQPAVLREGARIPKSMFVTTGGAMSASKQQLNMTSGSTESTGGGASQSKFLGESRDISVEDLMATARGEEALTAPPRKSKKGRRDASESSTEEYEYETTSNEQEAEYSS